MSMLLLMLVWREREPGHGRPPLLSNVFTVAETEYIPDVVFTYHYDTLASLAVTKIKKAANKVIANNASMRK